MFEQKSWSTRIREAYDQFLMNVNPENTLEGQRLRIIKSLGLPPQRGWTPIINFLVKRGKQYKLSFRDMFEKLDAQYELDLSGSHAYLYKQLEIMTLHLGDPELNIEAEKASKRYRNQIVSLYNDGLNNLSKYDARILNLRLRDTFSIAEVYYTVQNKVNNQSFPETLEELLELNDF